MSALVITQDITTKLVAIIQLLGLGRELALSQIPTPTTP